MNADRTQTQTWADIGQIVSVFARDPRYAKLDARTLLQIIMPPINGGQYAIARENAPLVDGSGSVQSPLAAILFARVSLAVDVRLRRSGELPRLGLDEWSSGPITWIIHSPGDQQAVGKLLDEVHHTQLGGSKFSAFIAKSDGSVSIRDFG